MDDDRKVPFAQPLSEYLPALKPGDAPSIWAEQEAEQEGRQNYAVRRAAALLSFFRRSDIDDPDVFVTAVAATLARYPVDVIDYVTDVGTGLAAKQTFVPSVAEVRRACEECAEHSRRQQQRADAEERQLAERKARDVALFARPTLAELKAKHGPNWGLTTVEANDDIGRKRQRAAIAEANARLLRAEYARAGSAPREAAPGIPISAALAHKNTMEKGT